MLFRIWFEVGMILFDRKDSASRTQCLDDFGVGEISSVPVLESEVLGILAICSSNHDLECI